jgi:hypothetical protein
MFSMTNKKMIKYIKRKNDNKFLQSLENDVWVDNVKDAYEMTLIECKNIKTELLNTYTSEEITEVVNMFKNKPMSREEKKELLSLLKK